MSILKPISLEDFKNKSSFWIPLRYAFMLSKDIFHAFYERARVVTSVEALFNISKNV